MLKESEGDKCPWDFRGDEVGNPIVSFALCIDCPMMEELKIYGKANGSTSMIHDVIVRCEKED